MARSLMIVGAVLGLVLAAPMANAQQTGRPQPQPMPVRPSPPISPYRGLDAPNDPYRAAARDRQVFTQQLNRQALAKEPRERVERANRVGALIDQGRCGAAAQLARAEHDAVMADRVPDACAAQRTASHS